VLVSDQKQRRIFVSEETLKTEKTINVLLKTEKALKGKIQKIGVLNLRVSTMTLCVDTEIKREICSFNNYCNLSTVKSIPINRAATRKHAKLGKEYF